MSETLDVLRAAKKARDRFLTESGPPWIREEAQAIVELIDVVEDPTRLQAALESVAGRLRGSEEELRALREEVKGLKAGRGFLTKENAVPIATLGAQVIFTIALIVAMLTGNEIPDLETLPGDVPEFMPEAAAHAPTPTEATNGTSTP